MIAVLLICDLSDNTGVAMMLLYFNTIEEARTTIKDTWRFQDHTRQGVYWKIYEEATLFVLNKAVEGKWTAVIMPLPKFNLDPKSVRIPSASDIRPI